ncbi:hypothetical protein FRC07_013436, partial [Ceratobasidium sp. 392]
MASSEHICIGLLGDWHSKQSFIKDSGAIGNSSYNEISVVSLSLDEREIDLIDVPGFNEIEDDTDMVLGLSAFLKD